MVVDCNLNVWSKYVNSYVVFVYWINFFFGKKRYVFLRSFVVLFFSDVINGWFIKCIKWDVFKKYKYIIIINVEYMCYMRKEWWKIKCFL